MKSELLRYLATIGLLFVGASVVHAEESKTPLKHKLSTDFEACPNGHKELKDVPIVWGHFAFFGKHPRDYTEHERELVAKRDRREIEFGGDILPQNPPKSRVVCDRCGFTFYPSDLTTDEQQMLNLSPDSDAYWSRESKDTEGFKLPFSKQLLSFPRMDAKAGAVSYSQTLSADARTLKHEMISFSNPLTADRILGAVRDWLKSTGHNPELLSRVEAAYAHHTYEYNQEEVWIHIRDDNDIDPGTFSVSLMLIKRDANKSEQATPRKSSD